MAELGFTSGAPWQAQLALAVLFVALLVSAITDLRRKRIPNLVTLPALAAVLLLFASLGGLPLLTDCALGVLVCAGPLFLATLRGAMGAGDVKLMAVCGAVSGAAAGWPFSVTVLVWVAVAGGLQAVLWLGAAWARGAARPRSVPYGLAIAAGTTTAFVGGHRMF